MFMGGDSTAGCHDQPVFLDEAHSSSVGAFAMDRVQRELHLIPGLRCVLAAWS